VNCCGKRNISQQHFQHARKILKMKHETMKHCQQSLNNLIGAAIAQLKTMRIVPGKNLKDLIRVQLG
jgi:uncharacterized protein YicC (UPF0701 family)